MQSPQGEAKFEAALNERCVVGFDLLDMTLKQRVHQETTNVKLNINMFSNVNVHPIDSMNKQRAAVECTYVQNQFYIHKGELL